jgi:hypothetical protein
MIKTSIKPINPNKVSLGTNLIKDFTFNKNKAPVYQKVKRTSHVTFAPIDPFNSDIVQQLALENRANEIKDQFETIGKIPHPAASNSTRTFSLSSGSNRIKQKFQDVQQVIREFHYPVAQKVKTRTSDSQTPTKTFGNVGSQTNSKQLQNSSFQTQPMEMYHEEIEMKPTLVENGSQTNYSSLQAAEKNKERNFLNQIKYNGITKQKLKGKLIDITPFNTQVSFREQSLVPYQHTQPSKNTFRNFANSQDFVDRPIDIDPPTNYRAPKLIMDKPMPPPALKSDTNMFIDDKDGIRKGFDSKGYEINTDLKRLKDNDGKPVKTGKSKNRLAKLLVKKKDNSNSGVAPKK